VPGRGMPDRPVRTPTRPPPKPAINSLHNYSNFFLRILGEVSRSDGGGVCKYATITIMKAIIHQPVHESYKKHRQEIIWQILLPMVLTAILFIALIVLLNIATFRDNADVGRWAAASAIWISIPIIIMAFVFLAVLGGIVYLLMRLLQIAPIYTGKAQDLAHKVEGYARRAADAAVKPIIALNGIGASIQAFLGRK